MEKIGVVMGLKKLEYKLFAIKAQRNVLCDMVYLPPKEKTYGNVKALGWHYN